MTGLLPNILENANSLKPYAEFLVDAEEEEDDDGKHQHVTNLYWQLGCDSVTKYSNAEFNLLSICCGKD